MVRSLLFLLCMHVSLPMAHANEVAKEASFCDVLKDSLKNFRWKDLKICDAVTFTEKGKSVEGRPLWYAEFGRKDATNRTLILSMVHPDEVTPFYLGFMLAEYLKGREKNWQDLYVVVAPLVNPDGWFKDPKTRTNSRGVDVNRNFDTHEWRSSAKVYWEKKEKKSPRRFPGDQPQSEPETLFQKELIEFSKPDKILSIHAPLNMTDYDGPNHLTLSRFSKDYVKECLKFKEKTRSRSSGYFPGSLGNLAGHVMGIPTITLELPSSDPDKAHQYWTKFLDGIRLLIAYEIRN